MNNIRWSESATKCLIEMWANGDSASAIGAVLKLSRNAVIGKAHRLDLDKRKQSGGRPKGSTQPWVTSPKVGILRMRKHPMRRVELPGAVPRPKTLMELEEGDCRWPIGNLFCGAPSVDRHSYCAEHDRRGHDAVQRRQPKASPTAGEASKAGGVPTS